MLKSHMDAREDALIAQSKVQSNTGHSLHKGTPREVFIREFLQSHLPENVSIGSGEIIDAGSKPGDVRNQFDIVIYDKRYPKLDFGGSISGFLAESVIATIEVKSTLTADELQTALCAARKVKQLKRHVHRSFSAGYIPPSILNYVVAYNGPARMQTVNNWIRQAHDELGIIIPPLPLDAGDRNSTPSPSLDGVFVFKKGFVYFDNAVVGFFGGLREENPDVRWVYSDTKTGTLLYLFICLQMATANIQGSWLDPIPYLSNNFKVPTLYGTD